MLYLGIDGGGTKTEFCLADQSGNCIKRVVLGASNPVDIGMDNTLLVLGKGIISVCDAIELSDVSVFAGIAGILGGDYKKKILDFLHTYPFARACAGSDVENAVSACLQKEDGIAVIMGTGTIAFAQKNGIQTRFGGFGYLFDEGGSGYAIGRDGILAALKAEEGTASATKLENVLKELYAVSRLWDVIPPVYTGGKREIAAFAPYVFAAAREGDRVAGAVIERNMAAVAENIEHALTMFEAESVPVGLVGGITKQKNMILPMIENKLNEKARLFVCEKTPVQGALYLAGMEEKQC